MSRRRHRVNPLACQYWRMVNLCLLSAAGAIAIIVWVQSLSPKSGASHEHPQATPAASAEQGRATESGQPEPVAADAATLATR